MKLKSQSIIEYAVLIVIVALAVVSMNLYVKRSVNANLKSTEEQINAIDWRFVKLPKGGFCLPSGSTCEENNDCCSNICNNNQCGEIECQPSETLCPDGATCCMVGHVCCADNSAWTGYTCCPAWQGCDSTGHGCATIIP